MAEKDMDKFMELLMSGDHNALVAFAKTLENCPHCDHPLNFDNNNMICEECGLTILNLDPPNPLRGSKEVW